MRIFIKRIIGVTPEGTSTWDQTVWQRAHTDSSAFAGRAIPFMLICAPIFGAAGANILSFDSIFVRSAVGALIGLGAGILVWLTLMMVFAVQVPGKYRAEAQREIAERRQVHDLIQLDTQLRALKSNNLAVLEEVKADGRTGPLGDDDDPWVRSLNLNLKLSLEDDFPELVPQLVLENPPLGTWEDVKRASRELDANFSRVLSSDLLIRVRELRESVAAELKEQRKDLPSERLAVLYDRMKRLEKLVGKRGFGDDVMEWAAHTNEVAKVTREVEEVLQNVAPEFLIEWRTKVAEWYSDPSGSERLDERLKLLDGIIARLRAREPRQ